LLFNALLITGVLSGLAWLLLIAFASLANYPDTLRPLIALAGLAVSGNALLQTAGSALRGFERMDVLALTSSGLLLLSSTVGIALACAGVGLAAQVWVTVLFASSSAALVLFIVHRRFVRLRWAFDAATCRRLLQHALPVAILVAYGVLLRWVDVLILGQVRGLDEVAVYGSAIKIIDLALIFSTSAAAALFPILSSRWRESVEATHDLYVRSLRFFAAFGLAAAVGVTLLADLIVEVVYGAAYRAAVLPLRLLAWAYFFQVISGPMGTLLIAAGERLRKFVPISGAVVFGNVALNLWLAPRYGAPGAALAFLLTGLAIFAVRQWMALEYFQRPPHTFGYLLRPALAALVMSAALWLLRPMGLLVAVPAGALIFIGVLWLTGELKEEPYRGVIALIAKLLNRGERVTGDAVTPSLDT
jgi:O-antigen/teichoic acid export membrane protein